MCIRDRFTASFHVNTDSSMLIGTDTFTGGEVRLRRGPIALAAQYGGFCVLDEINMAKNDAVAVLHSVLDYRRLIDVPGYECIPLHPATRFIATKMCIRDRCKIVPLRNSYSRRRRGQYQGLLLWHATQAPFSFCLG